MFRLSDWQVAMDEYNKAALNSATMAQYNKDKEVLTKRLPIIFEVSYTLGLRIPSVHLSFHI